MRALRITGCLLWCLCQPVFASGQPPHLWLQLAPTMVAGTIEDVAVSLKVESPRVAAGETLLTMPITLVSTPTAAYSAEQISASDASGSLPLQSEDLPATPSGQYRRYYAARATQGVIKYHYHTAPRVVDATTRNGPLFDLRRQQQGMMGAGVYFLALPAGTQPYSIELGWDLSAMPKGSLGVWSGGENTQQQIAPAELLRFSYYAAGLLHRWSDNAAHFSMYWLDKPPFDMQQLPRQTAKFYRYMAQFFGDQNDYRVFARSNPYPAGGGTGLAHSFMFGYGSEGQTIAEGVQILLAHEMSHTWPTLNGDEPHAETAWYTEGTAEYYAIVMSQRAGISSHEELLRQINLRAAAYYANPYLHLNNHAAGELFWKDARAQKVPYGRGFMYFFKLNQQLLQHSQGRRSVDDLVLEVYRRQQQGEIIGLAQWREILKRELGDAAVSDFNGMTQGEVQVPPATAFHCLQAQPVSYRPFDLGFDEMRLGEVTKLRPDSEAAKVGLQNGDTILKLTALDELRRDASKLMVISVSRHGKTLSFHYLPRGPLVAGWQWQFSPQGPAACHI